MRRGSRARRCKAGAERIVAIGGDGTINEVVNGFFDETGTPIAPDASFALIPFGTGGDFRRTMNIPTGRSRDAAAVIKANHKKKIDVGKLELTTTSGGKPAAACSRTSRRSACRASSIGWSTSRARSSAGCRSCSRPRARRGRTRTSACSCVRRQRDARRSHDQHGRGRERPLLRRRDEGRAETPRSTTACST